MTIFDVMANIPAAELTGFVMGALALNFAPGQDVLFASACGIQGGPRAGALAGLGVGMGVLVHLTMATLGIGPVIAAHPAALDAIKYCGAAYLLWLAWKSWRASRDTAQAQPGAQAPTSNLSLIRRGIMSNVLNPKPVLFLLAFLPQFTDPARGPIWMQILGLGALFAFSGTLVTIGYGVAAGLSGHIFGPHLHIFNRVAAVIFAALALRLLLP